MVDDSSNLKNLIKDLRCKAEDSRLAGAHVSVHGGAIDTSREIERIEDYVNHVASINNVTCVTFVERVTPYVNGIDNKTYRTNFWQRYRWRKISFILKGAPVNVAEAVEMMERFR